MSKAIIASVVAIPVVVIIAVIGFISLGSDSTESSSNTTSSQVEGTNAPTTTSSSSSQTTEQSTTTQADSAPTPVSATTDTVTSGAGTKTASVSFTVPEGHVEQMSISITTDAMGTITDASADQSAGNRQSVQYSGRFESVYKTQVVGKKLSGLSLSRIGGASLTTEAFNKALLELK
jgi:cytoskeletal protein RodZ